MGESNLKGSEFLNFTIFMLQSTIRNVLGDDGLNSIYRLASSEFADMIKMNAEQVTGINYSNLNETEFMDALKQMYIRNQVLKDADFVKDGDTYIFKARGCISKPLLEFNKQRGAFSCGACPVSIYIVALFKKVLDKDVVVRNIACGTEECQIEIKEIII
ncbi:MAG: hypothetical protein ACTSVY_02740 [Candidatus Helarchaeota archaeon]